MLRITFESTYHGRKTGRFGDQRHGYYYLRRSHYTGHYYRYAWPPAFKRTFTAVQQAQIDRFTAAGNLCNQLWKNPIERCRYETLFARYQHIQMLHPTWQKETVLYVMGVISEMPKSGTNSRKRTKNPYYRTARQLCMSIAYLRLAEAQAKPNFTFRLHQLVSNTCEAPMHIGTPKPPSLLREGKSLSLKRKILKRKSSAIKCTFLPLNLHIPKKSRNFALSYACTQSTAYVQRCVRQPILDT